MTSKNKKIREVEGDVLDQHHKQFNLLKRPYESALEHILCVYGDAVRKFEQQKGRGATFRRQRYVINTFTHALSHCFRWIEEEAPKEIVVPNISRNTLDEEAKSLLLWAAQYDNLAADHSAWSRGLISAGIDEQSRTITFSHPEDADALRFTRQIEARQALIDASERNPPIGDLQVDFQSYIESAKYTPFGVHVPWHKADRRGILNIVTNWLERVVWPEIAPHTDLGGFTLADFRSVFAFLYTFCLYRTWLEDFSALGNFGLPRTEPLQAETQKFVPWLAEESEVSPQSANDIVELLTLDNSNFHAKVSNQPLIRSTYRTHFLVPRLIIGIDPSRMLAGAINKSSHQGIYDGLAETFEQTNLDEIECRLRKVAGFEVAREKSLSYEGVKISPDFFIFDVARNSLLIVDFKHVLAPYSTADVHHKLKDFEEWRPKMRDYISFAKSHLSLLTPHLPSLSSANPPSVTGMILTRWPLPIPIQLDEDMEIGDWASLKGWLDQNNITSVEELQLWAKDRPDVAAPKNFRYEPKDFQVGDWTYRRMLIISVDPAEPNSSQI